MQAIGDYNLACAVVEAIVRCQFLGQCVAQMRDTLQVRIVHLAILDGFDGGLFDGLWRICVGSSKLKMNDVTRRIGDRAA